jgi:hypothetical protein
MGKLVQVNCPKCQTPVSPDHIDAGSGIAYCPVCKIILLLFGDKTVAQHTRKNPIIPLSISWWHANAIQSYPPVRVKAPQTTRSVLSRTAETLSLALPRCGLRRIGCFSTCMGLFICAGVSYGLMREITDGIKRRPNIAGIAFVAVILGAGAIGGLKCLAEGIWDIFVETTLAINGAALLIERRILGCRFAKTYALADIKYVALTLECWETTTPIIGIGIHLRNRRDAIIFGSHLSDEEKQWLTGELYNFWQVQKAIAGKTGGGKEVA